MATGELRWGVIGAGAMAIKMAADISITPSNRVVAVASRTATRTAAVAARHAARVEPSVESLLRAGDVDVVYIATPPASHAELAIAALIAGKHVVVEKPFALSSSQARDIVDAARKADRFCMEAMWSRFVPAVDSVIQQASSGALGELRQLTADFSYALVANPNLHLFQNPGGGALLDRAVYGVSLAISVLGPVGHVSSAARLGATGVDEDVAVTLTHDSGVLATITASLRSTGTNEAMLRGTLASATLHSPFFRAKRYSLVPSALVDLAAPGVAGSGASGGTAGMASTAGTTSKLLGEVMGRLGQSVRARQTVEAAKGLTKAGLQHMKTTTAAVQGAGYVHQVAAVNEAIGSGLREHPKMTLQHSVDVMSVLDQARACW